MRLVDKEYQLKLIMLSEAHDDIEKLKNASGKDKPEKRNKEINQQPQLIKVKLVKLLNAGGV
ncbi:pentapeptide repeat protein [Nostoc cycadae WK-1]|uniref:Pentapeptide repeat protein n=1 Tax=Nostoc cycadae WK-1 TaxID=1861711 RepID=A0A2H6LLX4_9NOSO|nr:pentapeptide repeat protein [Nostoc cycadae WK-1]